MPPAMRFWPLLYFRSHCNAHENYMLIKPFSMKAGEPSGLSLCVIKPTDWYRFRDNLLMPDGSCFICILLLSIKVSIIFIHICLSLWVKKHLFFIFFSVAKPELILGMSQGKDKHLSCVSRLGSGHSRKRRASKRTNMLTLWMPCFWGKYLESPCFCQI